MPVVLRVKGYRFWFYEADLDEPPHVHVIQAENVAKVWLQPVELEYNRGYNRAEMNRILRLTQENQQRLLEAWNEHFDR